MFYSPLRYPGGKGKLAKFIASICKLNNVNGHYVEPYAGGASVALFLLMEGHVSKITINDFDRSIYAFWHSVLKNTNKFCDLIEKTEVTIENWLYFKEVQINKAKEPLLSLGLSTFFLNRTNISGIIDAGVIGGTEQTGKYKIDCRFNKSNLISRIRNIARFRKNITLCKLDALKLIDTIKLESAKNNTIFYFDPPYYIKGPSLYINSYNHDDHEKVCEKIKTIRNAHWIVSYDGVDQIKKMYEGFKKEEYLLSYTAGEKKKGREVLFFSPELNVSKLSNFVK